MTPVSHRRGLSLLELVELLYNTVLIKKLILRTTKGVSVMEAYSTILVSKIKLLKLQKVLTNTMKFPTTNKKSQ
jgi:hypothetical protein